MSFFTTAPKFLFFTGKGGVGKTSLACATAIALADVGNRVLLVSTDPASNLDQALGTELGPAPRSVPDAHGLWAVNLDPVAAAAAYREKVVDPYRGLLPQAALTDMEEQLSGACTVEIAAFDEFSRLLGEPTATAEFDHVVFDTAPTGHTLRLLSLPQAWGGFIETSTHGASCLSPLAGLEAQRELYATCAVALADPTRTLLLLVSRPEGAALAEASRASRELAELGVKNQRLLLNGIFGEAPGSDPLAIALVERGGRAVAQMPRSLATLPREEFPLLPYPLVGVTALRRFLNPRRAELPPPLASWVDMLTEQDHGVIMTMGKGGVGKTTVAAAIAIELARRGHRVNLTTTDPAAHLETVLDGSWPRLAVSRIDPKVEVATYAAEILADQNLGPAERALLEEDLRSPCTEEIAVFRAFAAAVDAAKDGFLVMDTAPTGHTILLLDAALAYHREVGKKATQVPEAVKLLLPRLRDPDYTRIILVTLPEGTPVHEAEGLQADLRRADIEPYAWVINQSLAGAEPSHPLLRQRAANEAPYIEQVFRLASRCALIPMLPAEPIGITALIKLIGA